MVLPVSMGGTAYEWSVAPYGLQRLPAAFSRAMHFALGELDEFDTGEGPGSAGMSSWVDDIAFHSRTFSGHCKLLRAILYRLALAGVSLKLAKTDLLRAELHVLGYIISREGLRMDPAKCAAINNMPSPANVDELRKV